MIKFTRLSEGSSPPSRSNPDDAGADLRSSEDALIPPLSRLAVSTGIAMEIPPGYYGRVAPRSGLALKNGIDVFAGVVDSGYRGEVKVILFNSDAKNEFVITRGDRIAQIIIEKHYPMDFVESESLAESERGIGGFGSTGRT